MSGGGFVGRILGRCCFDLGQEQEVDGRLLTNPALTLTLDVKCITRLYRCSPVQISALHSVMSSFRTSRLFLARRPVMTLVRIPCVVRHGSAATGVVAKSTTATSTITLPKVDNKLATDHGTRYMREFPSFKLYHALLTIC